MARVGPFEMTTSDSSADELSNRIRDVCGKVEEITMASLSGPLDQGDMGPQTELVPEPHTLDKINAFEDTEEFYNLNQGDGPVSSSSADSANLVQDESPKIVDSVVSNAQHRVFRVDHEDSSKLKECVSDINIKEAKTQDSSLSVESTKSDIPVCHSKADQENSHVIVSGNTTTDSLTRRVEQVLAKPEESLKKSSISALDSIEIKSVSSTTSSKYGMETKNFESTDLWRFVKQFIPPEQENAVRAKMAAEISQSSFASRTSSNPMTLSQLKSDPRNSNKVNKSTKSTVSEQGFVDGIVYSPMGSHKSSTPDHSLISGWRYTRDSEYINGAIRVAESESDQKESIPSDKSASNRSASYRSGYTSSAGTGDELSQRVKNLLKEIDTSLDESSEKHKSNSELPKLILDLESETFKTPSLDYKTSNRKRDACSSEREDLSFANSEPKSTTPRSIEDLTTDEKYGSFMPTSHTSKTPDSKPPHSPLILEDMELEEGKLEDSTLEDDLEATSEYRNHELRMELEKDLKKSNFQSTNDSTQNTNSILKSSDAEAPSFPRDAYGSRVDDKNLTEGSTLYQKTFKNSVEVRNDNNHEYGKDGVVSLESGNINKSITSPAVIKSANPEPPGQERRERTVTPNAAESVRIVDIENSVDSINVKSVVENLSESEKKTSDSVDKSIRVLNEETADDSTMLNQSQTSVNSSFHPSWFPKNMKEFKKLDRAKKKKFLKALKSAANLEKSRTDTSVMSSDSSVDFDVIFRKYPEQKLKEMKEQHAKQIEIVNQQQSQIQDIQHKQQQIKNINENILTNKIAEKLREDIARTIKAEIRKIAPEQNIQNIPTNEQDKENSVHSSISKSQIVSSELQSDSQNYRNYQSRETLKPNKNHSEMTLSSASLTQEQGLGDVDYSRPTGPIEILEKKLENFKLQESLSSKQIEEQKCIIRERQSQKSNPDRSKLVSFGTQLNESDIQRDMKALKERSQNPSLPQDLNLQSISTQTITLAPKPSQVWYTPVFTDRKVPIDRNALDSTKRLASAAWDKASIQESLLINKQQFISNSRARVRHIKLRKEQRLIEKDLEAERVKVFGDYKTESKRRPKFHPVATKHSLGDRRPINLKQAVKETAAKYAQLPEVIEQKKRRKFHEARVENSIKVQSFNKKIQSKVLNKL